MANIVKTNVNVSGLTNNVDVSIEAKLRSARTTLVSILASKKDLMEVEERMDFLRADEGLYAYINGMPCRHTLKDTVALAQKLLRYYGRKDIL
jgi:hypothetical protein